MPAGATLFTFVAATLVILLVPGPSVVYVMTRSIEQGRRAGLYSMLGLETGALLHVLGATIGLGALLASSEVAFSIVRYGGAGYLLYLGIRQLRRGLDQVGPVAGATATFTSPQSTSPQSTSPQSTSPQSTSPRRLYRDGVLVDLLNPKTALFFLAFLPQFVDRSRGPAEVQILVLGLCFVALAVLCDSCYAIVAGTLSGRLRNSARARLHTNRATCGIYFGLAGLAVVT